jgi:uncharacterized protein
MMQESDKTEEIIPKIEKELFLSTKPTKLRFKFQKSDIADKLNHSLEQLTLDMIEDCNMRCRYCINSGKFKFYRKYSNRRMDFDTARKSIDYFVPRSGNNDHKPVIGFYGGEPLLNFPLVRRAIDYTREVYKEKSPDFMVTTNGTLISKAIAEFFINNEVRLCVSLDGPRMLNDRYRKFPDGRGSYDTIRRNMALIKDLNKDYYDHHVHYQPVLCPPYHYEQLIEFFMKDELFSQNTIFVISSVKSTDSSLRLNSYEKEAELDDRIYLQNLMKDYLLKNGYTGCDNFLKQFFVKELSKIYSRRKGFCDHLKEYIHAPGICLPGKRRLLINSRGEFFPCERIEQSCPIGNVNDGFDLDKIGDFIEAYCSISERDCCKCWAFRLCGLCYIHAFRGGKLDLQFKRRNCRAERFRIANVLIAYMTVIEKNPGFFDTYRHFS